MPTGKATFDARLHVRRNMFGPGEVYGIVKAADVPKDLGLQQ